MKIPCCKVMDGFLGDADTVAGLVPLHITDLKNGKVALAGVMIRRSRKDPGIVLNFCPWCAKDLRPALAPHLAKERQAHNVKTEILLP